MRHPILLALLVGSVLAAPAPVRANDVDGGNDCTRTTKDYGDAPEGTIAYPSGVIGAFPTCLAAGPIGTKEQCGGGIGAPPGPAGYVRHAVGAGGRYWLGCFGTPASPAGVDGSSDGQGSCGLAPDCVQRVFSAFDLGQDECTGDNADAGLTSAPVFVACSRASITIAAWNCGSTRTVYLNVLLDMNHDGDWNDAVVCLSPSSCANEWAIANEPVTLGPGCTNYLSSPFRVGSFPGPAWMRVTLTDDPVGADFTWNGSATAVNGEFVGGETEDYPVSIDAAVGAPDATWGSVKTIYR